MDYADMMERDMQKVWVAEDARMYNVHFSGPSSTVKGAYVTADDRHPWEPSFSRSFP